MSDTNYTRTAADASSAANTNTYYYNPFKELTDEERRARRETAGFALNILESRTSNAGEHTRSEWESLRGRILIDGLARRGEVITITAPSKAGKSLLMLQLSHDMVENQNFLGRFKTHCEPGEKVLVYDMELNRADTMIRINDIYEKLGHNNDAVSHKKDIEVVSMRGVKMPFETLLNGIYKQAVKEHPCLIIFDCLYTFGRFIDNFDENNNAQAIRVMDGLRNLALRTDSVVCLVHHQSKTGNGRVEGNAGSGAGAYVRACDSLIELIRLDLGYDSDERAYRLRFPTSRNFESARYMETRFVYPLHVPDTTGALSELEPLTDETLRNRIRNRRRVNEIDSLIDKCFQEYPDGFTTAEAQKVRRGLRFRGISSDTLKDHLRNAGLICSGHDDGYRWKRTEDDSLEE